MRISSATVPASKHQELPNGLFHQITEVPVKVLEAFALLFLSFVGLPLISEAQTAQQNPASSGIDPYTATVASETNGSVYVPMDSWIYPALDRLHALGYLDTAYLGLRPWTRLSIAHMLQDSSDKIESEAKNDEAQ